MENNTQQINPDTIANTLAKHGYILRDRNTFTSCIKGAYQTFGNQEIHPTSTEKAAHIFYNIITQHPFIDGNKRAGIIICNMALYQEGHPTIINIKDDQWIKLATKTAQGKHNPHQIKTILNTWIGNT